MEELKIELKNFNASLKDFYFSENNKSFFADTARRKKIIWTVIATIVFIITYFIALSIENPFPPLAIGGFLLLYNIYLLIFTVIKYYKWKNSIKSIFKLQIIKMT